MAVIEGAAAEVSGPDAQARPVVVHEPPEGRVRVLVWQWPVRVSHWVNVSSIAVLSVTGVYIADPFLIPPGGSVMTTMRFVHMLAAYVFVASLILRGYWLFAGNRWARWYAFIPTNRAHALEIPRQLGWYLFLRRDAARVIGHNALAAATYSIVFGLLILQTATGFALAGVNGSEPWATLFGWLPALLGVQGVRLVHHLIMWATLGFMVHHVYSALIVDRAERNGLMSSIFSGYKFLTRREIEEARDGGAPVEGKAE